MLPVEPPVTDSEDGELAVLAIGSALAVLCIGGCAAPAERDRRAQSAMRRQTGRGDIAIDRRPSGRPRLLPPYPELGISLSHRGDLLLSAFSPTAVVGTDIELETPELEIGRLAADHFSITEADAIARLPPEAARDAFLRLWVVKEAALKVTGRGIHDGLAEPDCGHLLDRLVQDSAIIALPVSRRLPALQICARRLRLPGRPATYCALAVEA